MGSTPRQLWGLSSRVSTSELIKQNFKLTEELQQKKEAYAEMKEELDEVLVFKQEFMNMQDVFMMGQNRNGASPANTQYHNHSESASNVAEPCQAICTPSMILWYDKALVATGYVMNEDTSKLVWQMPLGGE